MDRAFADVILPLPLDSTFTYAVPEQMRCGIQTGSLVTVPFGAKKTYTGVVVCLHDDKPQDFEVKDISVLHDDIPPVMPQQIDFWRWLAGYYLCSVGDVFKAAMPPIDGYKPLTEQRISLADRLRDSATMQDFVASLKHAPKQAAVLRRLQEMLQTCGGDAVPRRLLAEGNAGNAAAIAALVDKGALTIQTARTDRLQDCSGIEASGVRTLTTAQQQALDSIHAALTQHNVCLLYGVTSCGKTEIYTHLMQECISQGRQVLYLLPEIAMTAQIMQRLRRVFGSLIGIYHSKWPDAQRVELWTRQLSDHPFPIILGVRSALFLPFQNLGLVIVDEEHENTYKQQDPAPRYNARNAAIYLAAMSGAKTVLGTATPSLETWYNATEGGKYGLVTLTERYSGVQVPEVMAVDIKELKRKRRMKGQFSPLLLEKMKDTIAEGSQVILFQNRRGYAPMLECKDCGWTPKCVHCDVSLTFHKRTERMVCHYCGFSTGKPEVCPSCGGKTFRFRGFGTERVEDEIARLLPEARVARLDLDTTASRTGYEKILGDFEAGRVNVLVGTQILSKGLDFGNVKLVGILNADNMLSYPDFRAYERAFQLMVQVSGRAGRRDSRGTVVLQTHDIDNGIIGMVSRNDYNAMASAQLAERRLFRYPPFCRMVYVYLRHRYENVVDDAARTMASYLSEQLGDRVSAPMNPPVSRVQGLYIRRIVLKIETSLSFARVCTFMRQVQHRVEAEDRFRSVTVYYDVDPQ